MSSLRNDNLLWIVKFFPKKLETAKVFYYSGLPKFFSLMFQFLEKKQIQDWFSWKYRVNLFLFNYGLLFVNLTKKVLSFPSFLFYFNKNFKKKFIKTIKSKTNKKIHEQARVSVAKENLYWGQKTLAWLCEEKSQAKDEWRTRLGWRYCEFQCNFILFYKFPSSSSSFYIFPSFFSSAHSVAMFFLLCVRLRCWYVLVS